MYNCNFCNRECKTIGALHKHERHCKANPNHIKQPNYRNDYNPQLCLYCGRICDNLNSKALHQKYCKANPNRIDNPNQKSNLFELCKHKVWSKGLTKESDARLAKKANALRDRYRKGELIGQQKGRSRTAEERNKISTTMRNNPNAGGKREGSGRGKKGWYKGFFCDSTYELVYIIYNLDHNIEFKKCNRVYTYEYQGETHKYYPDFELPDGSIVETKGYHSEIVDVKTASVTDRPIKVLFEKDLQYAFDWVKQNYTYSQLSDLYN